MKFLKEYVWWLEHFWVFDRLSTLQDNLCWQSIMIELILHNYHLLVSGLFCYFWTHTECEPFSHDIFPHRTSTWKGFTNYCRRKILTLTDLWSSTLKLLTTTQIRPFKIILHPVAIFGPVRTYTTLLIYTFCSVDAWGCEYVRGRLNGNDCLKSWKK